MIIPFILNHLGTILLGAFVCAYLAGVYSATGFFVWLSRNDYGLSKWERIRTGLFWPYYFIKAAML